MDALKNLSTLHDFYAKLEVAKDEEVDTHHILLEPKGGSQLIQIAGPGYDDILEMDPDANANAGISAYRNQADIISIMTLRHALGRRENNLHSIFGTGVHRIVNCYKSPGKSMTHQSNGTDKQ
ncbi:uncharacterized protein EI90DRAFT_3012492 [Cantharellus anzutake]|uniref:uncharacterized protein n=1 Tax=Cantharellus anzutake TaxID=1750568 RepID=UPI001907BD32|nr:uncharacterized protein EI90DRAFT_3012492 [Cantharellus anzutake]KAF8340716.1 hypothetical protein EI90DRAFT_3012492 [Cantharellus anzutake]